MDGNLQKTGLLGAGNGKKRQPRNAGSFSNTKREANTEFFKFISKNYASWINSRNGNAPIMSNTLFKKKVLPYVEKGTPTFFIIDR